MPFRFERLEIPGIILIEPQRFEDRRGSFMETYKRSEFAANGIPDIFTQDNFSHSVRGVLRGLHFQKHPKVQAKLVGVIRGEIFDVAVDIRRGSPTYGRWVGVLLSAHTNRTLYIPVGFAHGFCVVSDDADVVYKTTAEYASELECGIAWNDPELSITWPVKNPILSPRDACLPGFTEAANDFLYRRESA